jgi:cytosine/creatinine deaminase
VPSFFDGARKAWLNVVGEEDLLRSRGVDLEVLQDPTCIDVMRRSIRDHPGLWSDDIGR